MSGELRRKDIPNLRLGQCLAIATVIIDILKKQMYAGCNTLNTNIKLKQNLRTVYLHDFF